MKDHTRRLALALAAAASVSCILPPSRARAQSPQTTREGRRSELEMRQRRLWGLEALKNSPRPRPPARRLTYGDVAEEFKQLQLVNYSLAAAAVPGAPLDYARIKRESAEVRKRASRLKGYLLLPEVEGAGGREEAAGPGTPESLRSAVAALDALVNSFVWNPVFQRPGVVDLEQSSKASRDLAQIIGLSERIRRRAEELARGARSAAKN